MEMNKKGQVALMFDNIAQSYDRLNQVLSLGIDRYWRWRAIRYLKDVQPQTILDVATGTADLAIATAKQLQPTLIVGVDISEKMLDYGRIKVKNAALDKIITLKTGDAENLSFSSNTFDAITVSFGVRNFENLEKGIAELYRVVRSGGRLVVLEFSKPQTPGIKQLYNFYFTHVLPRIGRLVSKDTSAYKKVWPVKLPSVVISFFSFLTKNGFKTAKCIRLTFGICSIYIADK